MLAIYFGETMRSERVVEQTLFGFVDHAQRAASQGYPCGERVRIIFIRSRQIRYLRDAVRSLDDQRVCVRRIFVSQIKALQQVCRQQQDFISLPGPLPRMQSLEMAQQCMWLASFKSCG